MEYEIIAERETPIHEVWCNGECVFKGYYDECEEFIKEMTEEL